MPELSQFLYVSRIAGPRAFETVSSVVAEARPLNSKRNVSGLLVFDGAQVCQYVEGEVDEIDALAARIANDTRHEQIQVLLHERLEGPRRFERWRLGYLNLDHGKDLSIFRRLRGAEALRALVELVPSVDIEP